MKKEDSHENRSQIKVDPCKQINTCMMYKCVYDGSIGRLCISEFIVMHIS